MTRRFFQPDDPQYRSASGRRYERERDEYDFWNRAPGEGRFYSHTDPDRPHWREGAPHWNSGREEYPRSRPSALAEDEDGPPPGWVDPRGPIPSRREPAYAHRSNETFGAEGMTMGQAYGYRQRLIGRPAYLYGERHFDRAYAYEPGPHRGRGPKDYQRSDDRIRDDINDRLTEHPEIDASDIAVVVRACEVTLQGTVEDRYTKRLAEELAETVSGVRDVQNQLRISRPGNDRTEPSIPASKRVKP